MALKNLLNYCCFCSVDVSGSNSTTNKVATKLFGKWELTDQPPLIDGVLQSSEPESKKSLRVIMNLGRSLNF